MKSFLKSFAWYFSWPIRAIGLFLFGIIAVFWMVFIATEEQMDEIEFGVTQ
ncbi:hypothetical protein LCGC14_0303000 [marine sediment metagenome]|uniref:Uncharacterized protein n=1 Tax=marine sediment metagenome TaxID=412755 RepID=A0A0F9TUM3_9ZZZZ